VGAARATLTREDSERSRKFEEPWQSRPRDWRGVGHVFLQGRVKGLAKSLQRGMVEMLLELPAIHEFLSTLREGNGIFNNQVRWDVDVVLMRPSAF
jgi:hypothetical protein